MVFKKNVILNKKCREPNEYRWYHTFCHTYIYIVCASIPSMRNGLSYFDLGLD